MKKNTNFHISFSVSDIYNNHLFADGTTNIKSFSSSDNLKEYLLNKDYVSCSNISFKFLGISLAGYNIIVSFVLFTLSIIGFRKLKN